MREVCPFSRERLRVLRCGDFWGGRIVWNGSVRAQHGKGPPHPFPPPYTSIFAAGWALPGGLWPTIRQGRIPLYGSAYFQAESEKTHGQSSPLRRVRLHPGQNGVVNVLKSVVRMKLLPALTASACERDPLNAARVPCGVSERMGRAVYSHICADLMKNAEIL